MKRTIRLAAAPLALLAIPVIVHAQPTAHYVPGIEGIKAATLPPPGFYLRDYTVGYYANRANNSFGDKITPGNFEAYTIANVPRAVYITEFKVLGGNVGVDALLPIAYQSVEAGRYKDDKFGIGDFFAEGTLSWHPKRWDFSVGAGIWAPTGDFEVRKVSIGSGYWTPMLTAGATWYIDEEKTWSLSALNRYEFNTEQDDTEMTRGQAYTLEYGLAKAITKTIEVGAAGYFQQQVTNDEYKRGDFGPRDRAAGIGPEVTMAFPSCSIFASLRYAYEFLAESRAEGHTMCLTVTKRF
jgi:hypothetical protein